MPRYVWAKRREGISCKQEKLSHFSKIPLTNCVLGGFPRRFYDAYQEINPLRPGYERRRDLYNFYHLLNHLNLFGGSYLTSVQRVIRAYGD